MKRMRDGRETRWSGVVREVEKQVMREQRHTVNADMVCDNTGRANGSRSREKETHKVTSSDTIHQLDTRSK